MDTLIWKRRLSRLHPTAKKMPRKIILLYHAVGNGAQAIPARVFSEQMAWLNQHCKVMSLSGLLSAPPDSSVIQVSISFDDGYACLYNEVAPILEQYNLPAIVYLNTGWIMNSENSRRVSDPSLGHYVGEQFLTWSEVSSLVQRGWEIGSHGVDHLDLTQQNNQVTNEQLSQSKEMIESQIQKPCSHFAYTWGKHSKRLRAFVEQNHYYYAAAAHHRVVSKQDDPFAFPRMNIEKSYSMNDFIHIVQGKWDFIGIIHSLKKGLTPRLRGNFRETGC